MDPRFRGFLNSSNGVQLGNQSMAENGTTVEITYPDQKLVNGHKNQSSSLPEHSIGGERLHANESLVDIEDDYQEDCDFSDEILRYIDQMLMEEDMDDKIHMLQESLDFQAKEKSFYEVLGKKYPPSPQQESAFISGYGESAHEYPSYVNHYNLTTSTSDCSGYLIDIVDPSWSSSRVDYDASRVCCHTTYNVSNSSISSSNSLSNVMDGFSDSPISPFQIHDMYSESQPVWNFRKGVEEASKFLPSGSKLLVNVAINGSLLKEENVKEEKDDVKRPPSESRVRKNRHIVDTDLEEERSSKLPAVYSESNVPEEEFEEFLLHSMGEAHKKFAAYREILQNEVSKSMRRNGQLIGYGGAKGRGKKQNKKKEVIDLRTLLINCAQAVAADDRHNANELLKKIRQHSSPFGDGNQRLAHYFANGLEARLAGTGSQIHKALVNKRTTAADYLKAYYTYLASSPFRKISNFASNKTIMMKAQAAKATRVHIIDFGILYGFQWPTLIQRMSARDGGPPKLRITGIDFPQPGFRPAERIEDTGRRLAHYAKTFKVPFEYKAIAQKWETVKIEDLKIEKDEFVVVNCLYRTKNLLDETVVTESARTMVLNLIRKINPDIFIHGIVNGAYGAPFFVTRFREVLFHFSALFDMLETNVPSEKPERMLIERDIFGREALNVIACEGWERVERPETYKQWQVRDLRAGFMQIPFEREFMDRAKYKVRTFYHKDFVIDEDSQWLLMGWKGRTIFAISCWKPV